MHHFIKFIGLFLLICTQCINLILTKPPRSHVKITKFMCETVDTSFIEFPICDLSRIGGNVMALNMYGKLNMKNVENITILAKLFRKINNKFRPFLYDDVIDYCDFHLNAKRHVFWNILYKNLGKFSNMNHSCPYNHDLIIRNLTFDISNLKVVPIPRGEYMIQYKYVVWSIYRCQLIAYVTRY
ncbi:uncharacterized protein LOC124420442 [Lucilia cuprina]|uniref:uncharacterized protein LOC124420442 n=1 Tax=Lucilia cuprina TaxID=7375 RepID=UPI001F057C00|nr:uncharacterized protein LOC124420442 [Lucilia cuprina]